MIPSDLESLSDHDVAMRFESLGGGGHGCEFGIFQRQYKAEPLSLFRWADINEHQLTRALNTRLEGIGEPEFTVVFEPPPGHHDEWWTRDTRYHMAMRTFVKVANVPHEKMVQAVRRRSTFLREKLIADLTEGDKIFVYRNMFHNLTEEALDVLCQAVHAYGDNTLFYVRYADEGHPHGTIEFAKPGLLIGYISNFTFSRENQYLGSAEVAIMQLCKRALAIIQNTKAASEQRIRLSASQIESLIRGRSFTFSRIQGSIFATNLYFLPHGAIGGYQHHNESSWETVNNALLFKDSNGVTSTRYDIFLFTNGGYELRGKYRNEQEYNHSLTENSPGRHGFASIIDKDVVLRKSRNSIAVLIRSHTCGDKFKNMLTKLDKNRENFDLYAIVDETHGRPKTEFPNVIWHSVEDCRKLGLTQGNRDGLLHKCGDFPFYFAVRKIPEYTYYIIIEDDVEFIAEDSSFVNDLSSSLLSYYKQVDVSGINFSLHKNGHWAPPCEKVFGSENCYYMTFPFIVMSRPAACYLFSQRLLEAARGTLPEDVVNCEAFAPSAAMAAGFHCVDLSELIPNCYDHTMMMHSGPMGYGRPLGYKPDGEVPIRIFHPVYAHAEFVRRLEVKVQANPAIVTEHASEILTMARRIITDPTLLGALEGLLEPV